MKKEVAIIGAGAWGTTLAGMIARKGYGVAIWSYLEKTAADINQFRENRDFLPGIAIPPGIEATCDLAEAVAGARFVFFASPSHTIRKIVRETIPHIGRGAGIISVVKGIEEGTFATISSIVASELAAASGGKKSFSRIAVVSGPNLAREIAAGLPSTTVVASTSRSLREKVQALLASDKFRVYTTSDVPGVELGGSLKNIMAIGAGICDGLSYGDNTKAAFLTRCLREFVRIGKLFGAKVATFNGLSGIGDLFATSYSKFSRNRTLGELIARGNPPEKASMMITGIAEGFHTARAAHDFGRKRGLDLPVINEIYRILYEKKDPRASVASLMTRTLKGETE